MTGAEYIKHRIETGDRFLVNLHKDDRDLLAIILEQYAALRQPPVSGSLLSDLDYWKQRCLLAEKCLEESPCDPDITSDQIKAWNAYHKFISWAGNDR